MKKFLLSVIAASFAFAAFAAPVVEPTAGAITIVINVPEVTCDYPTLNFIGDAQGDDPAADGLPEAVLVEEGWYKFVLPAEQTRGKVCPRSLSGSGTWNYQAHEYDLGEACPEWLSKSDSYGDDQLDFAAGAEGQVAYVTVVNWKADFCNMPNPEGDANFTVSFEIPETADPNDVVIYVEGQGEGFSWAGLGEIYYDEDLSLFSGTFWVPTGCSYKYLISYKGQDKIYMKGANLNMPYNMSAIDEVAEWDKDPFEDPIPGGVGNFTVTFEGECLPSAEAGDQVFIAGNFVDTPSWERVYEMQYDEAQGLWAYNDLTYPAAFQFKFVVKYNGSEEELWTPADNIPFDDMTFDYTVEGPCPTVDADEVSADETQKAQKVIIDGERLIITPTAVYKGLY